MTAVRLCHIHTTHRARTGPFPWSRCPVLAVIALCACMRRRSLPIQSRWWRKYANWSKRSEHWGLCMLPRIFTEALVTIPSHLCSPRSSWMLPRIRRTIWMTSKRIFFDFLLFILWGSSWTDTTTLIRSRTLHLLWAIPVLPVYF